MSTAELPDQLFTVKEAADFLKLSERRVRKLCSTGRLGERFGQRSYMIHRDQLTEFAKVERRVGAPRQNPANRKQRKSRRKSA